MAVAERSVEVQGVARHLGVAEGPNDGCIGERGLPAHRVGRLFRFKLSEVDAWVRQGNQGARSVRKIGRARRGSHE